MGYCDDRVPYIRNAHYLPTQHRHMCCVAAIEHTRKNLRTTVYCLYCPYCPRTECECAGLKQKPCPRFESGVVCVPLAGRLPMLMYMYLMTLSSRLSPRSSDQCSGRRRFHCRLGLSSIFCIHFPRNRYIIRNQPLVSHALRGYTTVPATGTARIAQGV